MIDQLKEAQLFPLKDYQKQPNIQWRTYKDNLPDQTLTYGVNCELSNLVVIDIDCHSIEQNGFLSWAELIRNETFEDTFTVSTPNNGTHYYFQDTTNGLIKNSAGKLAPGIDVRGNGGYVVGPNSYYKNNEGEIFQYSIENDAPIQPLPEFLKNKILDLQSQNSKDQLSIEQTTTNDESKTSRNERALVKAEKIILDSNIGERNDTLNKVAYKLALGGVDTNIIIDRLTPPAKTIGLEDEEINKTLQSAVSEGYSKYISKQEEKEEKSSESPFESPSGYFSDSVLARRLAKVFLEEKYRFLDFKKEWVKYNNTIGVWEKVSQEAIYYRINDWCFAEVDNTMKTKNPDMIKASMRCLNKSTTSNLAFLVNTRCLISEKLFDANPDVIVVENGVVNLKKKILEPFSSDYYITKRIPLPWDNTVKSKYLDKILDALPEGTQEWFMIMAGQSLTGRQPSSDRMFFMKGNGSNGKSTILNLMNVTAGEYGGLPPQASLVRTKNSDNFNTIVYKGLHQAIVEEMPDKQLDTGRMKQLTGTDKVTARGLYQNNETFNLKCTVWVSCNILPQVVEYDYGTWRRIALIEFDKTYKVYQRDVIHKNDRLADNSVRLAALQDRDTHIEFLARRIEGAHEWYKNNMTDPNLPEPIVISTANWRKTGDNIRAWFEESLIFNTQSYVLNEDLRDSFNTWLIEHGYTPISHKVFLDRLENHDIFRELGLKMMRSGKIGKLTQSIWIDPKQEYNPNYQYRTISGLNCSHVKYVSFR